MPGQRQWLEPKKCKSALTVLPANCRIFLGGRESDEFVGPPESIVSHILRHGRDFCAGARGFIAGSSLTARYLGNLGV